ncbi:TfoX/Sxy family protein [Burkholderia cepacia]|uniref:Cell competence regulator n=1 Tax=Burkholderia cepacia GG4 TaxID=1009846 RepID=A0A9W3K5M8_BURCE|nr:TfoX/Sxy family protein [Burkholderia cepacia]AFQ49923.1 Cell competence regulator [Burkholderia cepacia GG4]
MSWQADKAHGDEIAYQIASLGRVEVTRFFSGAAMRLDGVMFGFIARGSLFLRVDDVNRPAFVAAGMGPFSYAGRTRTVALEGYYETPADVLEDAGALFDWCRGAYRAALLAGAPKRKAKLKAAREPASGAASKPAAQRKTKAVSKPAQAPESGAASQRKANAKTALRPVSEPGSAAAPQPVPKRSAKPVPKTEPKPAPKPASKPATKSAPKRKQA